MDPVLQAFLSWQFIFFCLAIVAIVFVFRKVAEYVLNNVKFAAKESKIWNELLLPIFPIFVGPAFAMFATSFPYPEGFGLTSTTRLIWGLVAGLLSNIVYKVVKSLLGEKITAAIQKVVPAATTTTAKETVAVEPEAQKNITDGEG